MVARPGLLVRAAAVALLVAAGLATPAAAQYTTYYVRTDGGSATECTGAVDAPYPGSGSGQPCAWNHPFQALPPEGSARIAGGDTLIIDNGSYQMGFGAPADNNCDQSYSWDCHMLPVPSGPTSTQPTRILGRGWDSGCQSPPELWGTERASMVLNLTDSSNVEMACLEITDHSNCIEHHNPDNWPCGGCTVRCERDTPPFGPWAAAGIYAEDSATVTLTDLHVHGLASSGIHAGRLTDWTVENVRLRANGWVGWDGDLWDGPDDSNSGDLIFRDLEVGYNGCAEDPDTDAVIMSSCWGQQAGGYGDGFAAGTSGGDWTFEDCWVHHNTSDGLDMLYLDNTATMQVIRLVADGNNGNPLKFSAPAIVENSLLVANCAYFSTQPLFAGAGEGDICRAGGNALAIDLHRGDTVTVVNTTITGQGDCLMEAGCNDAAAGDPDPDCDGSELVQIINVLFAGNVDYYQSWENTCLYWIDDTQLPVDPMSFDHDLVWQCKDDPCPSADCVCGEDPQLVNDSLNNFDAHLLTTSPAVDAGNSVGAPSHDLDGAARDATPDIGAYELSGLIFMDGFESGNTSEWDLTVP